MVHLVRTFWQSSQFARYFILGSIAATLQILLLFLLVQHAEVQEHLASAIALLIAISVNYFMQRRFTFASSARHVLALPSFVISSLLASIINLALFSLLLQHVNYIAAQCISLSAIFILNFTVSSRFVFRKSS